MRPRTLYAVAAAATAALLIALAVDLLLPGYHRTGANGHVRAVAVNMPPGARLCQPGQGIEAGTGRVRFYVRGVTDAVGPLDVTVESGGQVVARGRVPARHVRPLEEQVTAPVGRIGRRLPAASVCIVNRGSGMRILGDRAGSAAGAASIPAARQPAQFVVITLAYQLADKQSWLSFAPTVADRFSLVKATFFGPWTFWLTLIALLVLAIATIWWTARTVAR